jgi:hypothetical protein
LLPLCFGTAEALIQLIQATESADTVWAAILAGAACWIVIYLTLPKPMTAYVFGHELTHVLWAWLMGGKVKRFKATAKGGYVVLTRSNFLIVLAPYFFPIYAVAVVILFNFGNWFWNWVPYRVWFHLLLGAAYAFHVTLTWKVLRTRQSDIVEQGYLFSAVVIWVGNVAVLILAIPLLTGRVSVLTALAWSWNLTGEIVHRFTQVVSFGFSG